MTSANASRDRTAVVTGASRGLGQTIAEFLAADGYRLILTARDDAPLRTLADRWNARGASVTVVPGDVARAEHRAAIRRAVEQRAGLDLLVNNASELGPSPLRSLIDLGEGEWQRILEVNLLAPVALVRELAPALGRAHGLVVNISSDAAVGAYPGWGGYGASKAALDLASRTLAQELKASGISVVSVDPGDMRTSMHQAADPAEDISDRPLPDVTVPFWAWLLGRDPSDVNGQRFRAQAERWENPP